MSDSRAWEMVRLGLPLLTIGKIPQHNVWICIGSAGVYVSECPLAILTGFLFKHRGKTLMISNRILSSLHKCSSQQGYILLKGLTYA